MDNFALYLIFGTAATLLLAGAYGAAPVLLGRRDDQVHETAARRLSALGRGFADFEQDHLRPSIDAAVTLPAGGVAPTSAKDQEEEVLLPLTGDTADQDELLADLFAEIGMLRLQIEGLRRELGGFAPRTGAAAETGSGDAASEPRRRGRAASSTPLPVSLRRRLGDVRRRRSI